MDELEKLVTAVLAAPKYRYISPALVRRVAVRELAVRRNSKEALKATKNKLHQVGGAYFAAKIDYARALADLQTAVGDDAAFRAACRRVMGLHTSTRERLPILEEFYATILADLPPVQSVMDVACGLNGLAWPWMPFGPDTQYIGYDIYADMVGFVGEFLALAGVRGETAVRDVISEPPNRPVGLVLLLKLLPVLAQVEETAVPRLLDSLQAKYLLISFPTASLGGRKKGMVANYEAQFQAWADGRNWDVQRFEFATELAFLVRCCSGIA
ncbi:MAG: 16S rRNA methyltransferase [Ardenticatenaceae bacterium]|nr:hypothetical protein [Anaerolineales bacterium]MCB8920944.1 16S rRNA methyltransferase [Ardenticatenaceae bacterium]